MAARECCAATEGDPDGDPAGAAGEILRAQDVEAHYQDGESACRTDPGLKVKGQLDQPKFVLSMSSWDAS
eukprot:656515-Prorocentrum_minimum.AAC.3